ncbi:SMC-Scp complex subunit ScpB [Halothiobacillus sp.]|uniref:SMC-Scp complex subunit ScpB n=1 Tax=Halothiobacillus sp. TaxID=1891311 RepID=UPI003D0A7F07
MNQELTLAPDAGKQAALAALIEALLLASEAPLSLVDLQRMIGSETPIATLSEALERLQARYDAHPFIDLEHREVAGVSSWRLLANNQIAPYLARSEAPRTSRYSRAVLESLALIAWRQPITRGEIEAVRGVSVNPQIIRTLVERGWIRSVGHKDTPGKPELLGTTAQFLQDFGLDSLASLPTFDDFVHQGTMDV